MYADITKPPAALPQQKLSTPQPGVSLLNPLSRRGHGPGLIILTPDSAHQLEFQDGVPSLLIKWAEEGFAVVQIDEASLSAGTTLDMAVAALAQCDKCSTKDKIALIAYSAGVWNKVASSVDSVPEIVASAIYTNHSDSSTLKPSHKPVLQHVAASTPQQPSPSTDTLKQYFYPKVESHAFALPFHSHFHYTTEALSHTRNLQFLKPRLGGPFFDLEAIWDEHTYYEFADRSVEHTMSTMVQEPYVNHVPTLTGGIGRSKLTDFYRHNFIFNNSADTELELISRTIGIDRVIDEFIFKFTHDREIDWLLPGVPPTNRPAEVPFTAVVNIRGDRLYHEHIAWDQGTLLRQLGLLPEYLPFPDDLSSTPNGDKASRPLEYRVPVTGLDTARKMRDRNAVPSNYMFEYKVRERE